MGDVSGGIVGLEASVEERTGGASWYWYDCLDENLDGSTRRE